MMMVCDSWYFRASTVTACVTFLYGVHTQFLNGTRAPPFVSEIYDIAKTI